MRVEIMPVENQKSAFQRKDQISLWLESNRIDYDLGFILLALAYRIERELIAQFAKLHFGAKDLKGIKYKKGLFRFDLSVWNYPNAWAEIAAIKEFLKQQFFFTIIN